MKQKIDLLSKLIYGFVVYFNTVFCEQYSQDKRVISMRDIHCIIDFLYKTNSIKIREAYENGL